MPEETHGALPPGTMLGEIRLDGVLGAGTYGIAYHGVDTGLNAPVAVKEYLPTAWAVRLFDDTVTPRTAFDEDDFQWGLQRFMDEARTLAQFQHAYIVRVLRIIPLNGTAYMVMDRVPGRDMKAVLDELEASNRPVDPAWIARIAMRLLDGLQVVHDKGVIHRDIKPANIILRRDEQHGDESVPVFIDFGAARYDVESRTQAMTAIYSPEYAPFEQWGAGSEGGGRQGPWTDIFALAATLYRVVVGMPPIDAELRAQAARSGQPDPLRPAQAIRAGHYPAEFLQAIDRGLAFDSDDRPQSVQEWRENFLPAKVVEVVAKRSVAEESSKNTDSRHSVAGLALVAVALLTLAIGGWFYIGGESDLAPPASTPSDSIAAGAPPEGKTPVVAETVKRAPVETKVAKQAPPAAPAPVPVVVKQPVVKATSAALGAAFRDLLSTGSQGPDMVKIPAGDFQMGSPASERGRHADEARHKVSVAGFSMSKYEITFAQYDSFCDATGRTKPSDGGWGRGNQPVINVSWHDATAYAKWLSEQTGKDYRLPTEEEWEYAARAGTTTAHWWGEEIGENRANCRTCGSQWDSKQTAPVGSFAPNPFWLHDTAGNVWEWTESLYSGENNHRVVRGGSWNFVAGFLRVAKRGRNYPDGEYDNFGFRVARAN